MAHAFDIRKSCIPFDQSSTLVAVIELSKESWLVGGIVPGLDRSPAKKLSTREEREDRQIRVLQRVAMDTQVPLVLAFFVIFQ